MYSNLSETKSGKKVETKEYRGLLSPSYGEVCDTEFILMIE